MADFGVRGGVVILDSIKRPIIYRAILIFLLWQQLQVLFILLTAQYLLMKNAKTKSDLDD